jgi:hypothetical protein
MPDPPPLHKNDAAEYERAGDFRQTLFLETFDPSGSARSTPGHDGKRSNSQGDEALPCILWMTRRRAPFDCPETALG